MTNWKVTCEEFDLIEQIALRAETVFKRYGHGFDLGTCMMDITAVHLNGTPLDLQAFLKGEDGDFYHDLHGIARHINRETGQLEDCFVPRFVAREAAS